LKAPGSTVSHPRRRKREGALDRRHPVDVEEAEAEAEAGEERARELEMRESQRVKVQEYMKVKRKAERARRLKEEREHKAKMTKLEQALRSIEATRQQQLMADEPGRSESLGSGRRTKRSRARPPWVDSLDSGPNSPAPPGLTLLRCTPHDSDLDPAITGAGAGAGANDGNRLALVGGAAARRYGDGSLQAEVAGVEGRGIGDSNSNGNGNGNGALMSPASVAEADQAGLQEEEVDVGEEDVELGAEAEVVEAGGLDLAGGLEEAAGQSSAFKKSQDLTAVLAGEVSGAAEAHVANLGDPRTTALLSTLGGLQERIANMMACLPQQAIGGAAAAAAVEDGKKQYEGEREGSLRQADPDPPAEAEAVAAEASASAGDEPDAREQQEDEEELPHSLTRLLAKVTEGEPGPSPSPSPEQPPASEMPKSLRRALQSAGREEAHEQSGGRLPRVPPTSDDFQWTHQSSRPDEDAASANEGVEKVQAMSEEGGEKDETEPDPFWAAQLAMQRYASDAMQSIQSAPIGSGAPQAVQDRSRAHDVHREGDRDLGYRHERETWQEELREKLANTVREGKSRGTGTGSGTGSSGDSTHYFGGPRGRGSAPGVNGSSVGSQTRGGSSKRMSGSARRKAGLSMYAICAQQALSQQQQEQERCRRLERESEVQGEPRHSAQEAGLALVSLPPAEAASQHHHQQQQEEDTGQAPAAAVSAAISAEAVAHAESVIEVEVEVDPDPAACSTQEYWDSMLQYPPQGTARETRASELLLPPKRAGDGIGSQPQPPQQERLPGKLLHAQLQSELDLQDNLEDGELQADALAHAQQLVTAQLETQQVLQAWKDEQVQAEQQEELGLHQQAFEHALQAGLVDLGNRLESRHSSEVARVYQRTQELEAQLRATSLELEQLQSPGWRRILHPSEFAASSRSRSRSRNQSVGPEMRTGGDREMMQGMTDYAGKGSMWSQQQEQRSRRKARASSEPRRSRSASLMRQYQRDLLARKQLQESLLNLKLKVLGERRARQASWLAQERVRTGPGRLSSRELDRAATRVTRQHEETKAELERESWAISARSYKELRQFEKLYGAVKEDTFRDLVLSKASNSASASFDEEGASTTPDDLPLPSLRPRKKRERDSRGAPPASKQHAVPAGSSAPPSEVRQGPAPVAASVPSAVGYEATAGFGSATDEYSDDWERQHAQSSQAEEAEVATSASYQDDTFEEATESSANNRVREGDSVPSEVEQEVESGCGELGPEPEEEVEVDVEVDVGGYEAEAFEAEPSFSSRSRAAIVVEGSAEVSGEVVDAKGTGHIYEESRHSNKPEGSTRAAISGSLESALEVSIDERAKKVVALQQEVEQQREKRAHVAVRRGLLEQQTLMREEEARLLELLAAEQAALEGEEAELAHRQQGLEDAGERIVYVSGYSGDGPLASTAAWAREVEVEVETEAGEGSPDAAEDSFASDSNLDSDTHERLLWVRTETRELEARAAVLLQRCLRRAMVVKRRRREAARDLMTSATDDSTAFESARELPLEECLRAEQIQEAEDSFGSDLDVRIGEASADVDVDVAAGERALRVLKTAEAELELQQQQAAARDEARASQERQAAELAKLALEARASAAAEAADQQQRQLQAVQARARQQREAAERAKAELEAKISAEAEADARRLAAIEEAEALARQETEAAEKARAELEERYAVKAKAGAERQLVLQEAEARVEAVAAAAAAKAERAAAAVAQDAMASPEGEREAAEGLEEVEVEVEGGAVSTLEGYSYTEQAHLPDMEKEEEVGGSRAAALPGDLTISTRSGKEVEDVLGRADGTAEAIAKVAATATATDLPASKVELPVGSASVSSSLGSEKAPASFSQKEEETQAVPETETEAEVDAEAMHASQLPAIGLSEEGPVRASTDQGAGDASDAGDAGGVLLKQARPDPEPSQAAPPESSSKPASSLERLGYSHLEQAAPPDDLSPSASLELASKAGEEVVAQDLDAGLQLQPQSDASGSSALPEGPKPTLEGSGYTFIEGVQKPDEPDAPSKEPDAPAKEAAAVTDLKTASARPMDPLGDPRVGDDLPDHPALAAAVSDGSGSPEGVAATSGLEGYDLVEPAHKPEGKHSPPSRQAVPELPDEPEPEPEPASAVTALAAREMRVEHVDEQVDRVTDMILEDLLQALHIPQPRRPAETGASALSKIQGLPSTSPSPSALPSTLQSPPALQLPGDYPLEEEVDDKEELYDFDMEEQPLTPMPAPQQAESFDGIGAFVAEEELRMRGVQKALQSAVGFAVSAVPLPTVNARLKSMEAGADEAALLGDSVLEAMQQRAVEELDSDASEEEVESARVKQLCYFDAMNEGIQQLVAARTPGEPWYPPAHRYRCDSGSLEFATQSDLIETLAKTIGKNVGRLSARDQRNPELLEGLNVDRDGRAEWICRHRECTEIKNEIADSIMMSLLQEALEA
ncbi:unnamed protein product, partial [Chrysoparadoxa australica]